MRKGYDWVILLLYFSILIVLTCSFSNKRISFQPSFQELQYESYIWKHDWKTSYVSYGDDSNPPLLLIPGFGVGAFHYERNIPELSKVFHVFSLDLLGQGASWPLSTPSKDQKLCYSVENWRQQIQYFLETVVKKPAHIAGNSLGGYLGICIATTNPELVKSLILINAAPFWSFLPPAAKTSLRARAGSGIEVQVFQTLQIYLYLENYGFVVLESCRLHFL